nr:MAG: major capsid protein [Microvirus sp.]
MSKIPSIFQNVRSNKPPRTSFDLGHEVKMSMKIGNLVPFFCQEVVPGDTFSMQSEIFTRMAPLIAPVMHRMNVYTHFFFVPNRLVWNEWQDFITGGDDGKQQPVHPSIDLNIIDLDRYSKGSLADYLGVPPQTETDTYHINALPFRAYQEIYNEYYRDQNLEDKVEYSKASGESTYDDAMLITQLRKRAWEKDYFTSALPNTQKGDEVLLPLAGTLDVTLENGTQQYMRKVDGSNPAHGGSMGVVIPGDATKSWLANDNIPSEPLNLDPNGSLKVDLGETTATTINDLREAFAVQRWMERLMRGGSRYIEVIKSFFGVTSSDARLQRPEYLGGGKNPIVISEVLQTSSTDATSPQGNMAGHGVSYGGSNGFRKYFEEHGFVIGIISILPRTAYQQGLHKQFRKFDRFDYYWPSFAHLGEQPVTNDELFFQCNQGEAPGSVNIATFGYQSRYAEYRYISSRVAGDMRDTLLHWHMGRTFSALPSLNENFIKYDLVKRNFAVNSEEYDEVYVQIYNNLVATRPMPFEAEPGLIDHY